MMVIESDSYVGTRSQDLLGPSFALSFFSVDFGELRHHTLLVTVCSFTTPSPSPQWKCTNVVSLIK